MNAAAGLSRQTVSHFGPDPAAVGGMSSVLRVIADHAVGADHCRVCPTWRPASQLENARLAARAAATLLRMPRGEVAHFHLSERGSFLREGALAVLSRRLGQTTIVTMHGAELVAFARSRPALVAAPVRAAHLVICLDEEARETVERLAPGVRVEVLPNPVPLDRGSPGADRTSELVLFAGEVGPRKGADVLLRAWRTVADDRADARCVMVGPNAGFSAGDVDRLELRPPVGPAEMRRLLRSCRLVALPSRGERLPMVLAEAMGAGRPFVSTPVGGIAELAREGGSLVAVDDDRGLANRILELLRDPALALGIGERGRRFCEATRSVEIVDDRLRSLYATAGSGTAARRASLARATR